MLHIPPTNLLLLAAKQEPYKKNYLLTKILKNFLEKVQKEGPARRKDRKGNMTRQKNKRGDSKVDSNDSPEIPDRGRQQTSPASLRSSYLGTERNTPVIPNWFQPCQCRCCLCYPGEYLGLWTLIRYNWTQVLEACDSVKLLSIYFYLCVDAAGIVCHQLGLLTTDLHAVGCWGFFETLN